jgi:hypothetical protein
MPTKPTKDSTPVNLELPTELVTRIRDFAQRDMRSIKAEFVRALRLLLDTFDKPGASTTETPAISDTGSGDTVKGEAGGALADSTAQESPSVLAQMGADAFTRFLGRLAQKGEKETLSYIAVCRRAGLTAKQIVCKNRQFELAEVAAHIKNLEKAAQKDLKP